MIDKKLLDELSAATRALEVASEKTKTTWADLNQARIDEGKATKRHSNALQAVADAA